MADENAAIEVFDRTTPHGEILDLAQMDAGEIAWFVQRIRDLEAELRTAKAKASTRVHELMDHEGKWTLDVDGWKIQGESPAGVDYDAETLKIALETLVEEGKISKEAAQSALKKEITFKPQKRGIDALLKLGGDVKELIEEARVDRDPARRSIKKITPPQTYLEGQMRDAAIDGTATPAD